MTVLDKSSSGAETHGTREFVSMTVAGQLFGIPVLTVQDVLGEQRITRVPLALPEVAGTLNLRGRIVTAIDMRRASACEARPAGDHRHERRRRPQRRAVQPDRRLGRRGAQPRSRPLRAQPVDARSLWREFSVGVYRLQNELLVVLDVEQLLNIKRAEAA